ncbi:MAG: sugar transferase [Bacteroidetes bacterium]|nr:sugar transferase [Bacteroidota bacterium]
MKRIFEIIFSLTVLILTLPLSLLILFIVFVLTKQFPIITQERGLTLEGARIKFFKIRTIRRSELFNQLEDKSNKIFNKGEYAEFVPAFCKLLRKSGLDELPQFINVLLGNMSIVGPRPLTTTDLLLMKEKEPEFYERRSMIISKPGITGCWQIFGDRRKGCKNLVELDELYDNNKSALFYLRILILTSIVALRGSLELHLIIQIQFLQMMFTAIRSDL